MILLIGADLRPRLLAMARSELLAEVVGESSAADEGLEASSVSDLERLRVAMLSCCGWRRAATLAGDCE